MALYMKADRAILKRQKDEAKHETRVAQNLDNFLVSQKGLWENKTAQVIRKNRVKSKVVAMAERQKADLNERRQRLAKLLSDEMRALEQEMVDREETPQQRMDRMASKAYELKKRREDERKAFVQEKLYQQWRDGIDELRTMDSKIVELKTVVARDQQLDEKFVKLDEEAQYNKFYDQLWQEGYQAKLQREQREKAMRFERNEQQKATLAVQSQMKADRCTEEAAAQAVEVAELKNLWAQQEQEAKEAVVRQIVRAKQERAKADEYMAIQNAQREEEERVEKEFDKHFVKGVLERERKIAEQEEEEREKAKRKAREFTEALKIEMAKKAQSEEELVKMQAEEFERQWAKRYAQWEKEELARRALMAEVYTDRAQQVYMKQSLREQVKAEAANERELMLSEVERLEQIEAQRERGEALVAKRHQEELFRQMDFHQVQRHRQLQQHAIEQRQAAIAEEKIRRAVKAEKERSDMIMAEVLEKRKSQRAMVSQAPWEK